MKRNGLIGLILLALFCVNHAEAQLKFGAKAGINLSSIGTTDFGDMGSMIDSRTGFQVGPMMELMVPILGVGADVSILYSQRGAKIGGKTVKSDFLEIPLNLKWKFGLPIVKAFVAAGPYVGFRLGDVSWGALKNQYNDKSFSAGLNIGAGVEVLSYLQVGANYTLGLTDNYGSGIKAMEVITGKGTGKVKGWSITAALLF